MCKRCFRKLSRKCRRLAAPIREKPSGNMNVTASIHPAKHHFHRHTRKRLACLLTANTKSLDLASASVRGSPAPGLRAARDVPARLSCERGNGPNLVARSISDHRAPSTSLDRVAVKMQNSKAIAAVASRSRKATQRLAARHRMP